LQPITVTDRSKRERLQGIAGQDGGRFTKFYVAGGLSAAQVIVVHRRQIVVNKRISVDHFQRASCTNQIFVLRPEGLACGYQQSRAKSLAAGKQTPANRRVNSGR